MNLQLVNFDNPTEVRTFEKGRFELYDVGPTTLGRATYEPGWKWSEHVGPAMSETSCQVEHVGLVMSGQAVARMDDGREVVMRAGDFFYVPPGHDSWVIGDEPYASLHILGSQGYAAQDTDESEIRELVEAWAQAVQRHDLDDIVAYHSSDILMFDVTVPPQLRGMEEYRESWRNFIAWLGDSGKFEVSELEVTSGADVAFCHGIIHCAGASSTTGLTIRLTIGLQKIDGQWTVIHEHHSEAQPR